MLDKRQSRLGNVTINQHEYMLFEEIGRGAASICYRGLCGGKKYVVKEFYPMQIALRNAEGTVIPSLEKNSDELFDKKKKSFAKAAQFHKEELHGIQKNDFLSVEEIDEENGYVVMNETDGLTLSDWAKKQQINDAYICECVEIVKGILDELEKYHKSGYVHLDLKAENIYKFDIENNQVLTRIFDFDSIQKIDTLYEDIQNKTAHIHTTNECYGKEIEKINNHSADNITKEMLVRLDYYAVAKILHYLIYGCYEKSIIDDTTPFEEYYGKCTVLNNYLYNLFKTLCADIENRDYSTENMKSYFDKLLFIIDNRQMWDMYSDENLTNKFKSRLMSDISVDDTHYTMQKGISAVEQVDEEYKGNLFLHGYDGGRGKTTAMQWLMFRKTGSIDTLYLYFPLCELRPFKGNINDEDENYEYVANEICRRYMLKKLPEGCTILLDGYNEIEIKKAKEIFDDFLKIATTKPYRIIISGRNYEEKFNNFMRCTLTGISDKEIKKGKNSMLNLNENLRTNPMLVELYGGIDTKNIPSEAKEQLIGKVEGDEIIVNSTGEALWNYFIIQIYEKSNGDERAAEDYKKYLFVILPQIANRFYGYSKSIALEKAGLNDNEIKSFERCNDLFRLMEFYKADDEEDEKEDGYIFVHQNYYDFFKAVNILDESEGDIVNITPLAAELMGSVYCEPIEDGNKIIVPKGNAESYYGNGKEIVESDEKIRYAAGRNLILKNLECMRDNTNVKVSIVRSFIKNLPKHHMNFSNLNIGWLLPHDEELYNEFGWDYIDVFEFDEEAYNDLPETYAAEHSDNFDSVCFDGSFICLQDNATQFFTDCSFKNLKEDSVLPYSILPKKLTIQIGNCIYTKDKKVLLDYIGGDSGEDEIILFEETNKIDEVFRMDCKNPDAKIINRGSNFVLRGKVLYREYGEYTALEFCQRDVKRLEIRPDITKINSYACAYCKDLISIRQYIPDNIKKICHHAFAYNTSLKEFIIPAADDLEKEICASCTSLEEIVIYADSFNTLELSAVRDCTSLKEIRVKDYSYMRGHWWTYDEDYSYSSYNHYVPASAQVTVRAVRSGIGRNINSSVTVHTSHSAVALEEYRGTYTGTSGCRPGSTQKVFKAVENVENDVEKSFENSDCYVSLAEQLNIPANIVIYKPRDMKIGNTYGLKVMDDYE